MQPGIPSRTARAAALQRAIHQVVEHGRILSDPLAVRIFGEEPETLRAQSATEEAWVRGLRFFLAVRSRFAEDALAKAVQTGVHQLVVLGAGLDTFAYRNPHAALRVFEVDHPSTQAWKRERLAAAGIAVPRSAVLTEFDFERDTLEHTLRAAGFDAKAPTFVFWLGVVVYLTPEVTWTTLRFFAEMPAEAHVVFDYANPLEESSSASRDAIRSSAARVAHAGEPWINFFDTAELHAQLRQTGYSTLEDLGPSEMLARYAPGLGLPVTSRGGHVMHASTAPITRTS